MEYNTTFEGKPLKIIDSNVEPGIKVKAGMEGKDYEFGKIQDSEYVTCIHKDSVCILLKTKTTVQCTCKYFRENPGMICEHLLALRTAKEEDFETAPADIIALLDETEGWTIDAKGRFVPPSEPFTPEVVAELPPDEVPNALTTGVEVGQDVYDAAAKKSQAKKMMYAATCQYCKLVIKAATQESADTRRKNHEKVCKENPDKQKNTSPRQVTQEAPPTAKPKPKEPETPIDPPDEPPQRKPHPTPAAVSTDVREMPSDAEFRDAKTGRILQAQGGFYKVAGGKEVPDAMSVQAYAVGKAGISTEVIKVEQDADHALAIVRCHKGDLYTDASVFIDFATQRRRELLKVANKNPKAVRGWDDNGPIFDDGFMVVTDKKSTPLVVYLFNRMTDFAYFAPRTAESQAARRAQSKMLGTEWRDNEEISTEAEEVSSVNQR